MKRLEYIDGIKGIGAAMVYLCHFVFAFYYAAYSLDAADAHTAGIEIAIGKSPLNLLFSGNSAVCIFLTVSGFLLCLSYFRTRDKKKLAESAERRYLRLMPPVLIVNAAIFALMSFGLYLNDIVAVITGSENWFALFNRFTPGVLDMLLESLVGCFVTGSNDYNGVLWTMPYLFLGALAVYLIAYIFGENRFRYLIYAALLLVALKIDVYYAPILLGFWACDVYCTQGEMMSLLRKYRALPVISFVLGIYFLSYPSIGLDLPGTIYILPAAYTTVWHIGGALLLLAGVLCLDGLQRFFGARPFKKLGELSYSLYLIHFPVIATFSCAFFLALYGNLGYHLTVLLDFLCTSLVVFAFASASRRYLEPLGMKLMDKMKAAHKRTDRG